MMNKTCASLALVATLLFCGGCSGRLYEPPANWWREGGRLCASNRDTGGLEWQRAAPSPCARSLADTRPAPETGGRGR